MLGLMTVKRHREVVTDLQTAVTYWRDRAESGWFAGTEDSEGNELVTIRADELATLRAQLPKRGEGGKFVGRAGA